VRRPVGGIKPTAIMAQRNSPRPRANGDLLDQLPTGTVLLHDSDCAAATRTDIDSPPRRIEHNTHGPRVLAQLQNTSHRLTGWDFHPRQGGVAFSGDVNGFAVGS